MSDSPIRESRADRKRRLMRRFSDAVFSCATLAEAAAAVGINPRTATRWLRSPEFKMIYIESQAGSPEAMLGFSRATGLPALQRLAKIIRDDSSAPTAAVAAARAVLDLMMKLVEVQELEERIRTLESLAGGAKN